jgi:UDP-3-O-[3-hydroxymyristoyl] glucosamine N-acyltransferase
MGAGAIASNQRLDKRPIRLKSEEEVIETGMTKLGAMLGDYAEIGCHSVLSPGTIIGRESLIYPLSHIRGTVERGLIIDGGREKRYRK